MKNKMKKLVSVQFEITEEMLNNKISDYYKVGDKYTHLQDPDTKKTYEPIEGYEVTGDDLSLMFKETHNNT
jgi:hypothetical protein